MQSEPRARQALGASVLVKLGLLKVRQWRDWFPTFSWKHFEIKLSISCSVGWNMTVNRCDLADSPFLRIEVHDAFLADSKLAVYAGHTWSLPDPTLPTGADESFNMFEKVLFCCSMWDVVSFWVWGIEGMGWEAVWLTDSLIGPLACTSSLLLLNLKLLFLRVARRVVELWVR